MKARVARVEVALAELRESFRDGSGAARWGLRGFGAFTVAESGQSSSIPHPDPLSPDLLEPVSGQVALCFPGKVISGGRDISAITSVEAECQKSRD